jgi:hypothetical protein
MTRDGKYLQIPTVPRHIVMTANWRVIIRVLPPAFHSAAHSLARLQTGVSTFCACRLAGGNQIADSLLSSTYCVCVLHGWCDKPIFMQWTLLELSEAHIEVSA